MASFNGNIGTPSNYFNLYVDYSYTQSVDGNYSDVTATAYVKRNNTSAYPYNSSSSGVLTINGTSSYYTGSYDLRTDGYKYIMSNTVRVYHESDGTKSITISFSFNGKLSSYYPNGSVSQTVTLNKINRYANITTYYLSNIDENSISFTWGADSSCDSVQYSLNGGSWTSGSYPTTQISSLTANTQYSVKIRVKRTDSQLWTESSTNYITTYDYPKPNSINNFNIGDGATVQLYNPLNRNVTLTIKQKDTDTVLGTYTGTYAGAVNSEFKTDDAVKSQYASITGKSGTYYAEVVCSATSTTKTSGTATYSVNETLDIPELTATVQDYNEKTYALTNNRNVLIPYYSTARITPAIVKLGESRDENVSFSKYTVMTTDFTTDYIDINASTGQAFIVKLTNSRGITSNPYIARPSDGTLSYVEPTITECDFKRNAQTGSQMLATFNGTFWNEYFDSEETNVNTLNIKYYARKSEKDEWTLGGTISNDDLTLNENMYSGYNIEISNPFTETGLETGEWDYMTKYFLKLEINDSLESEKIYLTDYVTIGIPYYDWWSENDTNYFNVNGKILMNNTNVFDLIYPVGSIYIGINSTNPSVLFGGTWEQITDRFLLAAGDTYELGTTGGEATHTLTVGEMPSHSHNVKFDQVWAYGGTTSLATTSGGPYTGTGYTYSSGGSQAHNNMPPYLVVYMWKRTA